MTTPFAGDQSDSIKRGGSAVLDITIKMPPATTSMRSAVATREAEINDYLSLTDSIVTRTT